MKKNLLFVLLAIFYSLKLTAQVQSNNDLVVDLEGSPSTPYTFSNFSVPNDENRVIVVAVFPAGGQVTQIEYNGTTYSSGNANCTIHADNMPTCSGSSAFDNRYELWTIPLGTGTSITSDLVISNSASSQFYAYMAASFNHVEQSTVTAIMTNVNTVCYADGATSTTMDITSAADDMAVDFMYANSLGACPTLTEGAGQTLLGTTHCEFGAQNGSSELSTSGTTTMSWTMGNPNAPRGGRQIGGNLPWDNNNVLPVELINFSVNQIKGTNKLRWQTVSETNNEGFEIEHSPDNRNWEVLGFVEGKGTTFEKQSYSFLHKNPMRGVNYYRLKQMDFDGAFEYSDIVSADLTNFENLSNLKIAPNPVQAGEVTLYIPDTDFEEANLEIYNSTGVLVQKEQLFFNQMTIQTNNLPKGIYLFSVEVGGQRLIQRVVVN